MLKGSASCPVWCCTGFPQLPGITFYPGAQFLVKGHSILVAPFTHCNQLQFQKHHQPTSKWSFPPYLCRLCSLHRCETPSCTHRYLSPKQSAVRRTKCLRASVKRAAAAALPSPGSGEKHHRLSFCKYMFMEKVKEKQLVYLLWQIITVSPAAQSMLRCRRGSPRDESSKVFPTKRCEYSRVKRIFFLY